MYTKTHKKLLAKTGRSSDGYSIVIEQPESLSFDVEMVDSRGKKGLVISGLSAKILEDIVYAVKMRFIHEKLNS